VDVKKNVSYQCSYLGLFPNTLVFSEISFSYLSPIDVVA
jgi:hypothetical protein